MEHFGLWIALCAEIEPHDPTAGNGRPPAALERMRRMYFVPHWSNLADAACEDALRDSMAPRRFMGIDLGRERAPDATTLLKFRRSLDKHKRGVALFAKVGEVLQAQGLKVGSGTIEGATIIGAAWLHQERREETRPGDAPDPQGPAAVLRHEAAHRRGQQVGVGWQRGGYRGQRARQAPTAAVAAWPGRTTLRRLHLCPANWEGVNEPGTPERGRLGAPFARAGFVHTF
jgi:IS5 family transposase